MTIYAIQERAVSENPDAGPQGKGWQANIAFTLEARNKVQAIAYSDKAVKARAKEPTGGQVNHIAANDNHTSITQALRFLSVCSGIEAASQAWPHWHAVGFSEIEKFPSAVLAHHYPDVPNLGDFTKIDTTALGRVDILCGGTPCQAFSVAGKREGLADARGNLTLSFVELAHELADGNGLRNVVWENVPGVLSSKDNAFGCFLAGLVGADAPIEPIGRWTNAGMVSGPKGRAAWRVLDAQYWGVAQRRRRVIVVADFGNGADPAAVLLVEEGVRRDSPPSREKGKDVAPTISARTKGGGGLGTDFDLDGGLVTRNEAGIRVPRMQGGERSDVVADVRVVRCGTADEISHPLLAKANSSHDVTKETYIPEIARCVATREGSSQDYETTTMVAVGITGQIAHTLKAEGADASEDGTGRGTPIVSVAPIAFTAKDYGADAQYDLAPTLRAGGHSKSHANAGVMPAVTVAIRGREGGATAELGGPIATALCASQGGGDKPHVLYAPDVYSTLSASEGGTMTQILPIVTSAVRRLTPVECERLQGFPDNYTRIPWRGKPAEECPDGPRYKALGNSWAVPLFSWLGRRIDIHMPPLANNDNNKDTTIADAA